jgi:PAS domain S-box-containing protein
MGREVVDIGTLEHTQEHERHAETILDLLPDPVAIIDLDGRIKRANRQFLEVFGQMEGQVQGQTTEPPGVPDDGVLPSLARMTQKGRRSDETMAEGLGRFVGESVGGPAVEHLSNASLANVWGLPINRIAKMVSCGGPMYFTDLYGGMVLEHTVWPIVDDRGTVISFVVFARDITKQVQVQRELCECYEQLRDSAQLALLGRLSTALMAELMQPLSVVRLADQTALAKLEKQKCPNDDVRQDLTASVSASTLLTAAFGCFRDHARQLFRSKETDVRIDRVAERMMRLLESSARRARMAFRSQDLETLPTIRMQENELEQIFFFLVQNAVQAADGVNDHHLLVTATARDNEIDLRFADDCSRIEPANPSKISHPFSTTRLCGNDLGLGLTIVRRIVKSRDGRLLVENRHAQGATLTVTLPVTPGSS